MSACHKRGRKRPANVRGGSKGREALQPNTPRGQHDIQTLQRRQRRFNRAFNGQQRESEWYCRECWKSNWLRITHCRDLNHIAIWYADCTHRAFYHNLYSAEAGTDEPPNGMMEVIDV